MFMQSKLHMSKQSNGRIRKHLTLFRSRLLGRTNKGNPNTDDKKVLNEYTGHV